MPTQARRVFFTERERSAATSSTGICLQSARRCVLAQGHPVAIWCRGLCALPAAALYAPTGVGFWQWHTLAHQTK